MVYLAPPKFLYLFLTISFSGCQAGPSRAPRRAIGEVSIAWVGVEQHVRHTLRTEPLAGAQRDGLKQDKDAFGFLFHRFVIHNLSWGGERNKVSGNAT